MRGQNITGSIRNHREFACNQDINKLCGKLTASGQPTGLTKAVVSLLGNDNVIKQLDSENFAGLADTIGHLDIFAAGSGVARRMIMTKDDGGRI